MQPDHAEDLIRKALGPRVAKEPVMNALMWESDFGRYCAAGGSGTTGSTITPLASSLLKRCSSEGVHLLPFWTNTSATLRSPAGGLAGLKVTAIPTRRHWLLNSPLKVGTMSALPLL